MPPQRPPSLKTIALLAKVTPATVSMALRNLPCIPEATRLRIQKVADTVGYKRNELVSSVLSQARNARTGKFRGTIGFLYYWLNQDGWKDFSSLRLQHEGVLDSAETHGFTVDTVWANNPLLSARRLNTILKTRGIRHLVIPMPASHFTHLRLNLEQVTAITLGWRIRKPALNYVVPNYYEAMRKVIRELKVHGYVRIGFALWDDALFKSEGLYGARYLIYQHEIAARHRVKPFTPKKWEDWNYKRFKLWVEQENPDVIICQADEVMPWLRKMGRSVPDDLGMIHLDIPDNQTWSGMKPQAMEMGRRAVELVLAQAFQQGPGLPRHPQGIVIDSSWSAGTTIRHKPRVSSLIRVAKRGSVQATKTS